MRDKLHVLLVAGSTSRESSTRTILRLATERLEAAGCAVDYLDLSEEALPIFNPDTSWTAPGYAALKARVDRADVLLLGTPDYHGSMSGALKNFLDHFWKEFAGKLFASIVASYEKGLTVSDQIRTVARQCYAWSLPYGVSFADKADVKDGKIASEGFTTRFEMLLRDVRVYGALLAAQRNIDLTGSEPGFLAHYRKK
jgi:FMN reductase